MSQDTDNLIQLKKSLRSVSGDFWGERFSEEESEKIRVLASLFSESTKLDTQVKNVLNRGLAGGSMIGGPRSFLFVNKTGFAVPEWNNVVGGLNLILSPIAPDSSIQINVYAPDGVNLIYSTANALITFRTENPLLTGTNFNNFGPLYYIDIREEKVVPLSILGRGVKYFLGLDYDYSEGYLIFRNSPLDLFPDKRIIMETTVSALEYPLGYVTGTGPFTGRGYWVTRYLRSSQSVVVLERALNEIAGRLVFDSETLIKKVIRGRNGYSYHTEMGVLHARYPHTPLAEGTTYPTGYIVSPIVKCYSWQTAGDNWFRVASSEVDLTFPVSSLFPSVYIPNYAVVCELGSDGFVRIDLPGNPEEVAEWNTFRQHNELPSTGISSSLVDVFDLEEDTPRSLNVLDFLMQNVWHHQGLVIGVKEELLFPDSLVGLREFIDSHKLVNSVTLLGKWQSS
jgi:hypothetical protein